MNFDIWGGYRLKTSGFDESPFYGEPYTQPYYVEQFDRFGFKPRQHWNSSIIEGKAAIESLANLRSEYLSALIKQGYRFEKFDVRRPQEQAEKLHAVMTDSFARFMGYTPLPVSEFAPMFARNIRLMDPRLVTLVYDDENELAGFSVAYPDLSEAMRAMRGRDDTMAKLRFLWRRRRAKRAIYYLLGITKHEARKRRGTGRAIFCYAARQILSSGYDSMVAALMAWRRETHHAA
jgi:hypothetical protein